MPGGKARSKDGADADSVGFSISAVDCPVDAGLVDPRRGYMITLRQFQPGEVIIAENEMGETAYIIEKGRVAVIKERDGEAIRLGEVGAGETFGEMSMIDDKPRSATVTAVEETVVREIHRDTFFESLQKDPEIAVSILKVLFERLRQSHVRILQLEPYAPHASEPTGEGVESVSERSGPAVSMEGLTPIASQSLPDAPFVITQFPFLIGRKSRDPLSYNDLKIADTVPLQISRHHIEFIRVGDKVGVSDRGSHLGSIVDGQQLGGQGGVPGPIFFEGSEGSLILGNSKSPFRYQIRIV
jgi:CRP/FNR family transcriptional regulator, cyclic AMP receptor protein